MVKTMVDLELQVWERRCYSGSGFGRGQRKSKERGVGLGLVLGLELKQGSGWFCMVLTQGPIMYKLKLEGSVL